MMLRKFNQVWQQHYVAATFFALAISFLVYALTGIDLSDVRTEISINEIVIAASTVVLALFTWLLWRETAKAHIMAQAADIVVSFEPHRSHIGAIMLVVENVGQGVARNVKLTVREHFHTDSTEGNIGEELVNLTLFANPIPLLKSQQKIEHFVFMFWDLAKASQFHMEIEAEWTHRKTIRDQSNSLLNLSFMGGLITVNEDPLHSIAKSQEKIAKTISYISTHKRLRVDAYLADDRKKEKEALDERFKTPHEAQNSEDSTA